MLVPTRILETPCPVVHIPSANSTPSLLQRPNPLGAKQSPRHKRRAHAQIACGGVENDRSLEIGGEEKLLRRRMVVAGFAAVGLKCRLSVRFAVDIICRRPSSD